LKNAKCTHPILHFSILIFPFSISPLTHYRGGLLGIAAIFILAGVCKTPS